MHDSFCSFGLKTLEKRTRPNLRVCDNVSSKEDFLSMMMAQFLFCN